MKKLITLSCVLLCIVLSSCWRHDSKLSIHYTDNPGSYTMDARFGKSKTRTAERYMNHILGRENNISFINTRTDAFLTLDDGSKFYMKKSPGHILIKMNKDDLSDRSYHLVKGMCVGMKDVVLK